MIQQFTVKFIETESNIAVVGGCGEGGQGVSVLTGVEFQVGKINKFWRWTVVMAPQQMGTYLMPLSWTLKNGQNGKLSVMYVLGPLKKN